MKPSVPLKWHGGKVYLASRVVALFPPHIHYVEPFCGGCAVMLASDPEGRSELINDINGELVNFWRVLQHPADFAEMARILSVTPLSRDEWNQAQHDLVSPNRVIRAVAFFVRCRQSLAGRMKSFTPPTRTRTRRGMNGNVSEWLGAVDGLPDVHARLRRVFIENMDACKLVKREDTADTLFYCDPPYLHETRASPDAYAYEMSTDEHIEFLIAAKFLRGKVIISGYDSVLYRESLKSWRRHEFDLPNNAAGGGTKRRMTEVVWTNF